MGAISETYRYIVRSAGVRSGNPIVEGTRIAVHDVVGLLQNSETVDTLREAVRPQRVNRLAILEQANYVVNGNPGSFDYGVPTPHACGTDDVTIGLGDRAHTRMVRPPFTKCQPPGRDG